MERRRERSWRPMGSHMEPVEPSPYFLTNLATGAIPSALASKRSRRKEGQTGKSGGLRVKHVLSLTARYRIGAGCLVKPCKTIASNQMRLVIMRFCGSAKSK